MARPRPDRARLASLILTAALTGAGCAREPIPESELGGRACRVGEPGCVEDAEYILELDVGDAGYGASVLVEDDLALEGLVAFQLRLPDGLTELRVLRWNGVETSIETVDSEVGAYTALAKSSLGDRLYLAYQKPSAGVVLAIHDGTGWTTRVLDENPLAGAFLDMAIDVNGGVHLSYIDVANRDLRYLLWQDGAFLIPPSTVDTGLEVGQVSAGGNIGSRTAITLMPSQEPVVSYYDESNGQLRTAR